MKDHSPQNHLVPPARMPGSKFDAGKRRPQLVLLAMPHAMGAVIDVAGYGAKKYSDNNWLQVPNGIQRYTDAMLRHAIAEGIETCDPESGFFHAAHVAWNALARLELMLQEMEKKSADITADE
ncbi:hypothetical protein CO615_04685 [Lysobacteraceae bacterium NML75-0749]|nr:hypothetical protein CO615_04685 [Xanthomonadaceae bacterium NML75-0749]